MKILGAILILFGLTTNAQQDSVAWSKDYSFKEGIYVTYTQFIAQKPVTKEKIATDLNKSDDQLIGKLVQKGSFQYYDEKDSLKSVKTSSIWGYSQNGVVYISHGADYNRIVVIGSICHFTAVVQTPVYQHDPYNLGTAGNPGYTQEQFILDTKTGKILPFSVGSMESILVRDDSLYKEFSALSKKKKRQSIFLFLRKYNEKHPLLFPS